MRKGDLMSSIEEWLVKFLQGDRSSGVAVSYTDHIGSRLKNPHEFSLKDRDSLGSAQAI